MCSDCGRFMTESPDSTEDVLADVGHERERQYFKWGPQHHPDGTVKNAVTVARADDMRRMCEDSAAADKVTWADILFEEFYEAMAEEDPAKLRKELVQVAAVAVAWVEDIDSRRYQQAGEA